MPWWLAPAIGFGAKALGGMINRRGGVSPEYRNVLNRLDRMYEEGLPEEEIAAISQPYLQERKRIIQRYSRQAGASGIQSAVIQRQVTTPMARAVGMAQTRYKRGIMDQIAQLTSGAEPYRQRGRTDWASILGYGGQAFAGAWAEHEAMQDFLGGLQEMYGEEGPS